MPLPPTNLAPPFVITRASHVVLTAADLGASRAFYANILGFSVSDHDSDALYLRGLEEAAHHSLVITGAAIRRPVPAWAFGYWPRTTWTAHGATSWPRACGPHGARIRTKAARCTSLTMPGCR